MDPDFFQFRTALSAVCEPREAQAIARLVWEEVLGASQTDIYADKIKQISVEDRACLENILARLLRHEPIQYIMGHADFCGLRFSVNANVLIPRLETEELVAWVAEEQRGKPIRLLDGGTGSGCIAVSLAHLLPEADVEAWDISTEALAVAQKNADFNGEKVLIRRQSLLDAPLEDCKFHCIVSNPPYVRELEKAEMTSRVLNHEPHLALFVPDDDALRFYRALALLGKATLYPGGALYAEINEALAEETAALFEAYGYRDIQIRHDAYGKARMLKADK